MNKILLFLTFSFQIIETSCNIKIPNFSDYKVTKKFSVKSAPVNLKSHKDAKWFRTRLREGIKEGPNFAGHYTHVSIGQGAGNQINYIIDCKSGKVFGGFYSRHGVETRIDSRLLIVNDPNDSQTYFDMIKEDFPNKECPESLYTKYYKWENEKMTLLKTIRHK